ncbi:hypothetical protein NIES4103_32360 [Nostoc sp. NIES-4103]|nr:hypothetical protein NIES4103_32360 [Nostoc sp. NIES-4103]
MQSQSQDAHIQLAQWLHRLIETLRTQQGSTWRDLVQTVSGKNAVIDLDDIQLQVRAQGGEQLQIECEYLEGVESVNFKTSAETLRDVITGRLTFDAAVGKQKIHLRGSLQDLLGIHQVILGILADSAINPQLRHLWREFEQSWLHLSSVPPCLSLEHQISSYGELIRQVPTDVLGIEVYPPDEDSTYTS